MAIKGKGKTKSRPAPRAPRPAPVARKPPFFLRRWVQFVGGVLLGMGVVMLVVWATNGVRDNDAEEAAAAKAADVRRVVGEWQTTVDGVIAKIGSPGGGAGSVTVFPALSASVATLDKNGKDPKAGDTATAAIGLADEAATTLGGVDLPTLIRDKGLELATTNYVLNSKARMLDGIVLYGRVAKMVKTAVTADDPAVTEVSIADAKALLPIATRIFNEGYSDYSEALAGAGLLQPSGGLSGLSGLTGSSPG
jgi:hypothetical protein